MVKRALPPCALLVTLFLIWIVPSTLALALILPSVWYLLLKPFSRCDWLLFVVAGMFILFQNYMVLREEVFIFKDQDILLMPYYEPLLWGFYFLGLKRFFAAEQRIVRVRYLPLGGLALVIVAFSVFSRTPWHAPAVFIATAALLVLFHERADLKYAAYALAMGLVVEVFGVVTGQWWYPESDVLGIPLWFAPMWVTVGLMARRLMLPLIDSIDRLLPGDKEACAADVEGVATRGSGKALDCTNQVSGTSRDPSEDDCSRLEARRRG